MKLKIDSDEWYPVYYIDNGIGYGTEVEVDDKIVKRWRKTLKDFDKMQDEMEAIVNQDEKEKR